MPRTPPIWRRLLVSAIALATTFIVLTPAAHAAPGSAFVRVNQLGYPATSAKRAYLMSTDAEAGATFEVRNGTGAVVFSGPIGPLLGSWSRAWLQGQIANNVVVRTTDEVIEGSMQPPVPP
jgi:hypothetical protein